MANYFLGLPSPAFADSTKIDAMWTRTFGLHTLAYEGGPGPGGSSTGGSTGLPSASIFANIDALGRPVDPPVELPPGPGPPS